MLRVPGTNMPPPLSIGWGYGTIQPWSAPHRAYRTGYPVHPTRRSPRDANEQGNLLIRPLTVCPGLQLSKNERRASAATSETLKPIDPSTTALNTRNCKSPTSAGCFSSRRLFLLSASASGRYPPHAALAPDAPSPPPGCTSTSGGPKRTLAAPPPPQAFEAPRRFS